jgi:hypothetical protein
MGVFVFSILFIQLRCRICALAKIFPPYAGVGVEDVEVTIELLEQKVDS